MRVTFFLVKCISTDYFIASYTIYCTYIYIYTILLLVHILYILISAGRSGSSQRRRARVFGSRPKVVQRSAGGHQRFSEDARGSPRVALRPMDVESFCSMFLVYVRVECLVYFSSFRVESLFGIISTAFGWLSALGLNGWSGYRNVSFA